MQQRLQKTPTSHESVDKVENDIRKHVSARTTASLRAGMRECLSVSGG